MTNRNALKFVAFPSGATTTRDLINTILDEALICHVGFVSEEGYPVVIPTIHARSESTLYLHGSPASRMLRTVKDGADVCVTVTLVDGLVLARSVFHHSMNYRSVVVFGNPREVTDPDEKMRALEVITDHVAHGRWADARHPNDAGVQGHHRARPRDRRGLGQDPKRTSRR